MAQPRTTFTTVGHAESVSFLVLLLIAMPIKYLMGNPLPVKYVGWVHGALFISYGLAVLWVAYAERWAFKTMVIAMIAAFVPFGPWLFGRWYWGPKTKTGTQA